MDLYSFIGNNFSTPSPKNQGPETPALQAARNQGTTLNNDAGEQTRKLIEAEAFAAVKEELLNRINTLENHIAALKREQNNSDTLLRTHIAEKDNALGEAAAMITEKSLEVERLRSDISGLQQAHQETLSRIQKAEQGNQKCLDETEKIRIDRSMLMRRVIIACIAVLIVLTGLFIYFSKHNAGQQSQASRPVSAVTTKDEDKAAIAAWPRSPITLTVGDFMVSLSALEPEAANKLTAELKDAAAATHNFYNIEIRAKRGAISAGFLKSPSIDFININGIRAKSVGPESDLKIIQTSISGKQRSGKGNSLFRCIVSLKKEFQPVGILIGGLAKKTRVIAIYS